MNRKIILFILLLSFSFTSELFALDCKSFSSATEIEVLLENENSEKENDEQDFYVEVITMTNEVCSFSSPSFFTSLKHDIFTNLPFRPPIV